MYLNNSYVLNLNFKINVFYRYILNVNNEYLLFKYKFIKYIFRKLYSYIKLIY